MPAFSSHSTHARNLACLLCQQTPNMIGHERFGKWDKEDYIWVTKISVPLSLILSNESWSTYGSSLAWGCVSRLSSFSLFLSRTPNYSLAVTFWAPEFSYPGPLFITRRSASSFESDLEITLIILFLIRPPIPNGRTLSESELIDSL